MTYLKRYSNKLRLVVNKMPSVMSVSVGIFVGAGSVLENSANNGISHFIEHMTFKGTDRMSAFEISEAFDEIGSAVNAFTSKEMTCYYVKSTLPALERSFEVLSDMFLKSTYSPEEIEKEKGVVVEEINMCEDTPEEVCFDGLSSAFFGDEGLGRTILGTADTVNSFDKSVIENYRRDYYNADNIVISFSGNISESSAEDLVERYFMPFVSTNMSKEYFRTVNTNLGKIVKKNKDIEQNHLAIAFDAIRYNGDYFNELSIFNCILGGGMSSRLFQKIREDLGLCYTVYSTPSGYRDAGSLCIYAGLNPNQTKQAYDAIFQVLKDIKAGGITQKEFEKGKAQVLSAFAFGQEQTSSQMRMFGKYVLYEDCVLEVEDLMKEIENIKIDRVNELIEKLNFDKFSLSLVGKDADKVVL